MSQTFFFFVETLGYVTLFPRNARKNVIVCANAKTGSCAFMETDVVFLETRFMIFSNKEDLMIRMSKEFNRRKMKYSRIILRMNVCIT